MTVSPTRVLFVWQFLDFAPELAERVSDPYYGENDGFGHVLDLVEQASAGLLKEILRARAG